MEPQQKISGIAGIFQSVRAADTLYLLLHAIQHRGPDGCGMAYVQDGALHCLKNKGMLSEVFSHLDVQGCTSAIGQVVRLEKEQDAQSLGPVMVRAHQGHFAIAFSGHISNAFALRKQLEEKGLIFQSGSDGELLAHLIQAEQEHLYDKITAACSQLTGSYTFLLLTKSTMYAMRSKDSLHPLFLAELENGYAFSSESASFSILETKAVRLLSAGTLIRLGKNEYIEKTIQTGTEKLCSMECIYYARNDICFDHRSVHSIRKECGRLLAQKETVQADMVIGVPDTAISAAMGFAQAAGIPYEIGLIKNRYIGSTFVTPSSEQRNQGLRVRLNAISSIVKGKSVIVVDDSLARGTTAKRLVQLLREAGADSVHLRIASPKMVNLCRHGYSGFRKDELAACRYTEEEMKEIWHLDSIRFLDLESCRTLMKAACIECFEGKEEKDGAAV